MNRNSRISLMGVLAAAVLLPAVGAQAVVRYVALDGSGAGGQTWATAYKSIQAALNDGAMTTGGEIWVKQGTYELTQPIVVTKAVRILGGYSGTAETRSWNTYRTTVDGMEKVFHCFKVTANATIDGFGIVYGRAAELAGPDSLGGGVLVTQCTATITNCVFRYNSASESGAALATYRANGSKIANCTFAQNTAEVTGGAIYNEEGAGLQILDCSFLGNASNDSAGAIHNLRCNPLIARCVFQENAAALVEEGVAGAILNEEAPAGIANCIFKGNFAAYGGGVVNYDCSAVVDNCWFSRCSSSVISGGGVYNYGGTPTILNCLFEQNSVRNDGGAIMDRGSGGKTINCIMSQNSADGDGGAIYISKSGESNALNNPQFINCTIVANDADWMGGGLYSEDTNSSFVNCIIWGNTANEGRPNIGTAAPESAGKPVVRYCDIEGTQVYTGTGNKKSNPMFVNADGNDLSLAFDSPCLDVGSNAAVLGVLKDYDGGNRIVDGDGNGSALVDMGAYERQGAQDHLLHGQIMRNAAYGDPSDTTATYTFLLRLETDDTLTSIDFQAPSGATLYTIPSDSHTSSGIVETYHRSSGVNHVWEYWAKTSNPSALSAYSDGVYRILAHYRNNTQSETRIGYVVPGTSNPVPQPTQKPQITTPAYGAAVASPAVLRWNACTDGGVNAIYVTVTDSTTSREAASEVLAKTAIASSEYRLTEGSYDAEVAFGNLYEVASTDGTPFQYGKTVLVGHSFTVPYTAVYRFWSPLQRHHFYTTSVKERDKLIKNYPLIAWTYEGIAFHACLTRSNSSLQPVYRLWSGKSHFYTMDEDERTRLLSQSPKVWTSEGIAFYAYPEGSEPFTSRAVYRFLNNVSKSPFFTISEAEANKIITQPDSPYTYQGVAFYAYPP